jgi:cation diffusion facilitator family transporter
MISTSATDHAEESSLLPTNTSTNATFTATVTATATSINSSSNASNNITTNNYSSLNDYIKHTYGSLNSRQLTTQTSSVHSEIGLSMCKPSASVTEDSEWDENETLSLKSKNNLNNNHHHHHQSSLRRIAFELSLYLNLLITLAKLVAYIDTLSLSVLAALLDSVLDVVSQFVLNYTEKHSTMQRSSAFYPAGASRLEAIGVLTCAALMGMASFEVLKESGETLLWKHNTLQDISLQDELLSFWSMIAVILIKVFLYLLCQRAHHKSATVTSKRALQLADPTLEALAQDHWNDILSNGVAAVALICALYTPTLWFLDPIGAILISLYIIWSWYETGKEQIEQLT